MCRITQSLKKITGFQLPTLSVPVRLGVIRYLGLVATITTGRKISVSQPDAPVDRDMGAPHVSMLIRN